LKRETLLFQRLEISGGSAITRGRSKEKRSDEREGSLGDESGSPGSIIRREKRGGGRKKEDFLKKKKIERHGNKGEADRQNPYGKGKTPDRSKRVRERRGDVQVKKRLSIPETGVKRNAFRSKKESCSRRNWGAFWSRARSRRGIVRPGQREEGGGGVRDSLKHREYQWGETRNRLKGRPSERQYQGGGGGKGSI